MNGECYSDLLPFSDVKNRSKGENNTENDVLYISNQSVDIRKNKHTGELSERRFYLGN